MTGTITEELLLSVPQVAKLLGVRRETCWRMAKAGKLGPLYGQPVRVQPAQWGISAAELVRRFGVNPEAIQKLAGTKGK